LQLFIDSKISKKIFDNSLIEITTGYNNKQA